MKRRPARSRSGRALLLFAVFFTNLLSLACQVLWSRKIAFLFGSTAAVFSTVLSIFLLGLALGALVAGRVADRHPRPWRLLAGLEIVLGVWCFFSLAVFELARGLYHAVFPADLAPLAAAAAKFLVVLVAMIAPTFAIGAAFSVAIRLASAKLEWLGRDVSVVYALDTLGAATGALVAGFVLVPELGLSASTRLLGGVALVLGLLLLRRPASPEKKKKAKDAETPRPDAAARGRLAAVLVVFFCTGCAALLLETGWIRFFSLLNGTHVYSSSTVLAGFLAGIGIGSLMMARRADRLREPFVAVAFLFAATAFAGALVFRSTGLFERAYFALYAWHDGYYGFQLSVCFVIAVLVALPALAMGANFPLVARIATRTSDERGFAVGRVYFVNTLGAVLGAFLAEFVVLPGWGFTGLVVATLGLYALASATFLALAPSPRRWRGAAACAVLVAAAVVASPMVTRLEIPFHALYYHGVRFGEREPYREQIREMTVVDARQSFYGQVAVVDLGGRALLLKNNGKTDASTTLDSRGQILVGHMPMLLHNRPERVLVIGLGGGFTLGAITRYEEPREIVMVEIDPEVVAVARRYFSAYTGDALDDPRVRVVTNDGRNFVDSTSERFDVISSEPPNIWVAGVSGLYTAEFYRTASSRLAAGGILCQWLPLHEMDVEDFHVMMRTLNSVFRYVAFWRVESDVVVLASDRAFAPEAEKIEAKLRRARIAEGLRAIGLDRESARRFLREPAARPDQIRSYLGVGETLNTDDRPVIEFSTARNLFERTKMRRDDPTRTDPRAASPQGDASAPTLPERRP